MRIVPASDRALLVVFGDAISDASGRAVRRLHAWLAEDPLPGVVDLHPGYASLLVRHDGSSADPEALVAALRARVDSLSERPPPASKAVVVPVRYGGEDGPDLPEVARVIGLSEREVIAVHSGAAYEVAFLGFSPGFPYLTGLPRPLATPRRASPRRFVPAGSVAIAGLQAGVYPRATPGGWNVIGRTDLVLFDPARTPACLLAPGDSVRFVPREDTP